MLSLTFRPLALFSLPGFSHIPMMQSLNSKIFPWSGLVMKSATILSVWKYSRMISPFSIQSCMKKYLILMCFFLLELEALPFFSGNIAVMLPWYSIYFSTSNIWLWRKAFVHNTCGDASWTPTTSLIVELVVFTFCLFDALVTHTLPMDVVTPVCPFKSGCFPYDASTYQWTTFRLFTFRWIFTLFIILSR